MRHSIWYLDEARLILLIYKTLDRCLFVCLSVCRRWPRKLLGRSGWIFYPLFLTTPGWFCAKKKFEKIQKGARGGPFLLKNAFFSYNSIIYYPIELKFLPLIPYDPGMVLGKKIILKKIEKGARGGPFLLKK